MTPRPIAAEVGWPRWVERFGETIGVGLEEVRSVWGVGDAVIEGTLGCFGSAG
jgi:hypothetical protein